VINNPVAASEKAAAAFGRNSLDGHGSNFYNDFPGVEPAIGTVAKSGQLPPIVGTFGATCAGHSSYLQQPADGLPKMQVTISTLKTSPPAPPQTKSGNSCA
jgi:hypothetical protein